MYDKIMETTVSPSKVFIKVVKVQSRTHTELLEKILKFDSEKEAMNYLTNFDYYNLYWESPNTIRIYYMCHA